MINLPNALWFSEYLNEQTKGTATACEVQTSRADVRQWHVVNNSSLLALLEGQPSSEVWQRHDSHLQIPFP